MAQPKNRLLKPMLALPMAAIGVLALSFLIYYFPVTTRQEAAVNERAFRSLSAISDSLRNRIVTFISVFEQAAKKGNRAKPDDRSDDVRESQFKELLNGQAPDFVIGQSSGTDSCLEKKTSVRTVWGSDSSAFEFHCGARTASVPAEKALAPYLEGLPNQIFDEIVLADSTGLVLFQSLKTGNLINNLASIVLKESVPKAESGPTPSLPGTPAWFSANSQSSTLTPAALGGAKFRLYLSPVALKLGNNQKTTGEGLVLGGLIRDERFRADTMRIPGSALVTFVLATLAIIIGAWPVIKFAYIRPTERLPRRSAVYFFLSSLGTIVLLCVLAIHLRYIFNLKEVDDNLGGLATAIEGNFKQEMERILQVMDSANRSQLYKREMSANSKDKACSGDLLSTRSYIPEGRLVTRLLNEKGLQLSEYPYFERIFFADSRGNQHIKWEVSTLPTSPTFIGDRVYYQETVNGNLWQFEGSGADSFGFRVDPVFSKNTGEYRAVVSMKPVLQPRTPNGPAEPSALCKDKGAVVDLSVMSLVTPLLSLSDPVMPSDYGFAIVDGSGNVLFHSISSKSGRENFFNELDDPRDVQVSVIAAQGKHLSLRYQGTAARIFVTPFLGIRRIPWSLIVFNDLSAGSAQNLERIVLFSVLAVSYFAIIALILLLISPKRVAPSWIWPQKAKEGDYLHLTLVLLLIVPAFYLLIFRIDRPAWTIAATVLITIALIIAMVQKLRGQSRWVFGIAAIPLALLFLFVLWLYLFSPASMDTIPAPVLAWVFLCIGLLVPDASKWLAARKIPSLEHNSFPAFCALVMLTIGILPSVAFFRVAYNYHADLATRRQQIETIAVLGQRETRIKSRYRNLDVATQGPAADVNNWLFLRRRLDQTLDRYDTVFLSLPKEVFAAGRDNEFCKEDILPSSLVTIAGWIPYSRGTLTRILSETTMTSDTAGPFPERPPRWHWCHEGINRIRLLPYNLDAKTLEANYRLPPTRALLKSVTGDPVFLFPSVVSELPVLKPWSWAWAGAVFLPAWLLTFLWVKPTLRNLFLLQKSPVDPFPVLVLDPTTVVTKNMILLTPDPSAAAKILQQGGDVHVIDFAARAYEAKIDCSNVVESVIAIEHFDYRSGSKKIDRKRLQLLERLPFDAAGKTVLLLATIDPIFYFGSGAEPSSGSNSNGDSERWARALDPFTPYRLADSTTAAHSRIFSSSTITERIALLQIAHEGWVNPGNYAALEHLERRQVISGIPFNFSDPEFAQYVRSNVSRSDRKNWEKQDESATWNGIRMTLLVLLFGLVAAVAFLNQETALSYVVTGLGVLTPLTKLLSEAGSIRSLLGLGAKSE